MKFSERLKELLGDESVYQFSKKKGLSHQYIYNILYGKYDDNPSPLISSRMCNILEISPEDLMGYDFQPDDEYILEVYNVLYTKVLVDRDRTNFNLKQIIKDNGYENMDLVSSFGFTKSNFPNIHLYNISNDTSQFCLIRIDSKKIYDRSSVWYIDQNIRDYINVLLLKNSSFRKGFIKESVPESIDIEKAYTFLCNSNKFLFVTSSLIAFKEMSYYNFNSISSDDIQVIFVRANYQRYSSVISGKQIIYIPKKGRNHSATIPPNNGFIPKPGKKRYLI